MHVSCLRFLANATSCKYNVMEYEIKIKESFLGFLPVKSKSDIIITEPKDLDLNVQDIKEEGQHDGRCSSRRSIWN